MKSEWKCKGPLVLSYALVMQTLYFSQFFTLSLEVYTEFVVVQMYICSLLVSCMADNGNVAESYIFLNEKHILLYSILSLECWKSHCRALKSQNLLREYAPGPPRGTGLTPPSWYGRVLYLNLVATSLLLKPLHVDSMRIKKNGYFNLLRDWVVRTPVLRVVNITFLLTIIINT